MQSLNKSPDKLTAPQLESDGQGNIRVSGELSFVTIPSLAPSYNDIFNDNTNIVIDLGGVTRADSAGVALLIEWQREAMQHKQTLRFEHVPAQILAIARVSGVDELLSLD